MKNILVLDTAIASFNRGDDIIMECVQSELNKIFPNDFMYTLPTHVSAFNILHVLRNSIAYRTYKNCDYKIAGGSNLLVKDLLTHFPQWNINCFNYQAFKNTILCGVGAGAGDTSNFYTKWLYRKVLSSEFFHSVRDERSKEYVESLGLKAINTGCVTTWKLTPDFCQQIPSKKASNVIFTLTASDKKDPRDQELIDILNANYKKVYFWVQGNLDMDYFQQFSNIENIIIVPPYLNAYREILNSDDIEYVGTRLHGGIFAMRHKKRAIIIVIDERAREINKHNNLISIEKNNISDLPSIINSEQETKITLLQDHIDLWKSQFPK